MMKEFIRQFYNEGLATTFYLKPVNYIDEKIKNKKIVKLLGIFIKVIYTITVLTFAIYFLYNELK